MGLSVLLDDEWLDEFQIETAMYNPVHEVGLLVGSKNLQNEILLKIYQLKYDEVEKCYSISHEIDSVTCEDDEDKLDFLEQLPQMIAFAEEEPVHQ